MIKSGGSFFYRGKRSVIGAVILNRGLPHMVTTSHIFRYGEGDHLTVDGMELTVTKILKDFDLALIELPPASKFEITELGSAAELEHAVIVSDNRIIRCRVVNAGASLIFLGFQCSNMPEPGDSGSPVLQAEKVIGIMSSVTLDTCMGIAISSNILRSLVEKENQIEGGHPPKQAFKQ